MEWRCQFIPRAAGSPNHPSFWIARRSQHWQQLHTGVPLRTQSGFACTSCLPAGPFSQQFPTGPDSLKRMLHVRQLAVFQCHYTNPEGCQNANPPHQWKLVCSLSLISIYTLKQRSWRISVLALVTNKGNVWNSEGPTHTWFRKGCCDGRSLCVWLSRVIADAPESTWTDPTGVGWKI